jgi:F0F1-type ATP synthase membrane subunit b/b'
MPQLDPTYFLSQFFWLTICFSAFYLTIHFVIIPKFRKIFKTRNDINEHSKTSAHISELQISEIRTLINTKSAEFTEAIQNMQIETNNKFQDYAKSRLNELSEELRVNHDRVLKEIAKSESILSDSKTIQLALPLAAKILSRITGSDVSPKTLTTKTKG